MKQFQSKATLFADLVEHLLDEMREETVSYVRKFPYGLPRIMARVDHVWELYKKPKALAMAEVLHGARGDPQLSERLSRVGRPRHPTERHLPVAEFTELGKSDPPHAGPPTPQ